MEHIIIAPKAEEPAPTNEDSKTEETTPTAEERLAALEKRLADIEEAINKKADEPAAEEPAPEAPKEESSDVAALKATLAKQDEALKALQTKVATLEGIDVRADLQGDPPETSDKPGEDTLDTLAKMEDPAKRSAYVAAHADDLIRDAFRRRGH